MPQGDAANRRFLEHIDQFVEAHRRYLEHFHALNGPPKTKGLNSAEVRLIDRIFHSRNLNTVGSLAKAAGISATHASKTLQGMLRKGLVDCALHDDDVRYHVYTLTDHGRQAAERLRELARHRAERTFFRYWPTKSGPISHLMVKVVELLERGY